MMKVDDKILVKRCLQGKKRAFETLVDRYQKIIFNLAYRMTGNYDEAEDITQCTFIKVFERLSTFNPRYKFFSWLYRIAVNESLNLIKSKKGSREVDNSMQISQRTPEQDYIKLELSHKIQQSLMKLEPQYRILILLKHFQYCSYREISDSLDIPEKTVKSRLYIARQQLKDILIKTGTMKS
jgi:RNA polymerase sigma-70 factor (ECF subfamily)